MTTLSARAKAPIGRLALPGEGDSEKRACLRQAGGDELRPYKLNGGGEHGTQGIMGEGAPSCGGQAARSGCATQGGVRRRRDRSGAILFVWGAF
jgi:hypothetical protein